MQLKNYVGIDMAKLSFYACLKTPKIELVQTMDML